MEAIDKFLQKFTAFIRPDTEPWFPKDITSENDVNLGRLLQLYTLWKGYASQQLSFTEADLSAKKEELRITEASELIDLLNNETLKGEFKAKEDRIAFVISLPEVAKKIREIALLTAQMKMEKSVLEIFEDRYNCVSRELTRRQAAWNH